MGIKTRYVSKRKEEENAHGEGRHDRKILQAKKPQEKEVKDNYLLDKKKVCLSKKKAKAKQRQLVFSLGLFLGGDKSLEQNNGFRATKPREKHVGTHRPSRLIFIVPPHTTKAQQWSLRTSTGNLFLTQCFIHALQTSRGQYEATSLTHKERTMRQPHCLRIDL